MLTVGSLFSGIGGLDLGLEQAGMKTVWQVEYDDWARSKLKENFPHTEKFKDVREVGKHNLRTVDLICGGFPCTDLSPSKFQPLGLDGPGSGLWFEFARVLRELRPRYALIENVPKLAIFGLVRVISDLAGIGYDAEWQTLRASAFGLGTRRKRLFVIARPKGHRLEIFNPEKGLSDKDGKPRQVCGRPPTTYFDSIRRTYPTIPDSLRVDNGVPVEFSEIKAMCKAYGNAVVPPVAKWIGGRIIEFHNSLDSPETTTEKS